MDSETKNLLESLLADSDKLDKLTPEQLLELEKKISPYAPSSTTETSECINISVSNQRDEYLRKFLMTSMVGYLFKTLDEWDPFEDFDDADKPSDAPDLTKRIKGFVQTFLARNLKYNPDRHVSSSHKEDISKKKMMEDRMARQVDTPTINDAAQCTYQSLCASAKNIHKCVNLLDELKETNDEFNNLHGIMVKNLEEQKKIMEQQLYGARLLSESHTHHVYTVNPPKDVFYHLDRYITNNFEELRQATEVLYNERSDFEFAIHYYGTFENEEEAAKYRRKNESHFICPLFTINKGAWTLLGPFRQNRDKIDFYNRNTEILKRLFDQMESDHKLGKDLMKKKVERKKKKEIKDMGSDPKGLDEYKSALGTIDALGAQPLLSREDKERLADAVKAKEMAEVPEDSVQVDVYKTVDGKLVKDKFYTEAEAPQFMSEQINELRDNIGRFPKKIVEDRHGNKVDLDDVRKKN
jgi:hypothetical protein